MSKKSTSFVFILIILLIAMFAFSSCNNPSKQSTGKNNTEKESNEAKVKSDKPIVLFDLAHREVFSPSDSGMRGMKKAVSLLRSLGFEVIENQEPFNKDVLSSVNTVMVAGAMSEFTEEELKNIKTYVENGGNLILTVHVNFFMAPLLEELGFQITDSPVSQEEDAFHGSNKDFFVRDIVEHPVTEGIESLAFMGTYGLKGKASDVKELVFSSNNAWLDSNGNEIKDESDVIGKFCLVCVREIGKGKVVVIGDDAIFSNMLIGNDGNMRLLKNIVKWFIGERGEGAI
ncbi:MAG: hypothetical protein N2440_03960 [Actinobacteria bacterium]|nr:hypothetical protein [Actinomycetota bacterium]